MRASSFEPDPSPVDPEAIALLPRRHREIIVFMAVLLLLLLSLAGDHGIKICIKISENPTVEE